MTLDFLASHPGESIALVIVLFVLGCIGVGLFLAWWAEREAQQQDRERMAHTRARIASWRADNERAIKARKHNSPHAAGLNRKRVG